MPRAQKDDLPENCLLCGKQNRKKRPSSGMCIPNLRRTASFRLRLRRFCKSKTHRLNNVSFGYGVTLALASHSYISRMLRHALLMGSTAIDNNLAGFYGFWVRRPAAASVIGLARSAKQFGK
jgi:hypothetical protein